MYRNRSTPRSPRHYVGTFTLPNETVADQPTAPEQPAPKSSVTAPAANKPEVPTRTTTPREPVSSAARRRISKQRLFQRPISGAAVTESTSDELYVDPNSRLSETQERQLEKLRSSSNYIGGEVLLEAINVVKGNLKAVVTPVTASEREILREIGVPGF